MLLTLNLLSFWYNTQMHSFMIDFLHAFCFFQDRLSVDITAYCTPSICSFTHAWFHKRCMISYLAFGWLSLNIMVTYKNACISNLLLMLLIYIFSNN
jgi:hypothetical protein